MSSNYEPARIFTVDQANAMLPLVRAITSDLTTTARELVERRHRFALLTAGRDLKPGDPYAEELTHAEAELEKDAAKVQEYLRELVALGVEPKGAVEGLIDFPAVVDGRIIYLCWRLGEPLVQHWHELDAGFAGRQSLASAGPAASDAAAEYESDMNETLSG
jgi:hypothetical protein